MILTFEQKLYPTQAQEETLSRWLRVCCGIYNRALEQRIKAYQRRGESVKYNDQQALLTKQRGRIEHLRLVPVKFERDALRRVDRGFTAFFRRLKAGQKPGFPRFRSWRRYRSLEYSAVGNYSADCSIRVPGLGWILSRGRPVGAGQQKILRVIHRESGWYAQIVVDDGLKVPVKVPVVSSVGIDVGLTTFAALSDGATIPNPRWLLKSARKLQALQRRVSRRQKGSKNRRKAVAALARRHERVALQRRNLCHSVSTDLVRRFDLIAVEKLNVSGMSRGILGKSILDAAWGTLLRQLAYKAENAGRQLVEVDSRYTSQECPGCGVVKPKSLSERVHQCPCGCVLDRDVAAAQVILARAIGGNRGESPAEGSANTDVPVARRQVGPLKQVNQKARIVCAK